MCKFLLFFISLFQFLITLSVRGVVCRPFQKMSGCLASSQSKGSVRKITLNFFGYEKQASFFESAFACFYLCMPKQSKIQKIQTAKKTKYREKIRKIIIVGVSLVLRKKCILKIQVQRGLYFTVFFQIQRANICIGMHSSAHIFSNERTAKTAIERNSSLCQKLLFHTGASLERD